jgi:hypothetical protein
MNAPEMRRALEKDGLLEVMRQVVVQAMIDLPMRPTDTIENLEALLFLTNMGIITANRSRGGRKPHA